MAKKDSQLLGTIDNRIRHKNFFKIILEVKTQEMEFYTSKRENGSQVVSSGLEESRGHRAVTIAARTRAQLFN